MKIIKGSKIIIWNKYIIKLNKGKFGFWNTRLRYYKWKRLEWRFLI